MTMGLTKPLAGIGEDGRHLYTCPLCEAMCGLEIHVSDGRVASVRGNHDDTWSHGHICPKGATLGALHEDPDRIRRWPSPGCRSVHRSPTAPRGDLKVSGRGQQRAREDRHDRRRDRRIH